MAASQNYEQTYDCCRIQVNFCLEPGSLRALHGCRVLWEDPAKGSGASRSEDASSGDLAHALNALKEARMDVQQAQRRKESAEESLVKSIGLQPSSSRRNLHEKDQAQDARDTAAAVAAVREEGHVQRVKPMKDGETEDAKKLSKKEKKEDDSSSKSRVAVVVNGVKTVALKTGDITLQFIKNPLIVKKWANDGWVALKDMAHHTWTGFKLLGVEVRTSWSLLTKRLNGHQLTRRERRQLVRTTADLARVGPFLFFILVPFMEFLLPVALKLFPNMLPSTFQDSYKREENMKRQLKLRIGIAGFLQDMVAEMEDKVKSRAKEGESQISVDDVQHFMERVRMGRDIDEATVLKVAKLFSDELTTDNMSRSQLVTLCRYMGLAPYGGDQFLRFQLRNKINSLRDDDSSIFFEGVDSLNLLELKAACEDRGMRATGLTMHQLRSQLKRWIDLSVNKNVPLSLLILSRAFTLQQTDESQIELAISEAISQMDTDVLQEALVAGAENHELAADRATISRLKLEAIQAQNDLIEMEIKEKSRKQAFIEQLRKKAEEELEAELDSTRLETVAMAAANAATRDEIATPEQAAASALAALRKHEEASKAAGEGDLAPDQDRLAKPLHVEDGVEDEAKTKAAAALQKADRAAMHAVDGEGDAKSKKKSKKSKDDADGSADEDAMRKEATDEMMEEEARKVFESTLESIKVLAADSPVEEERNTLEEILERQEEMEAAKAVYSGRIVESEEGVGVAGEKAKPEKRSRSMLKNKLRSMLERLEADVQETGERIGDKLSVLDLDRDGKISSWEIRKAIGDVLRKKEGEFSEERLGELISRIDKDDDGVISIKELQEFLDNLKHERRRSDGEHE
ncbi:Mitochondrial proton/calcium exchanger protein [Hondaea fermentalgiana]|uniref:Mitochondrial proton/calcium exchanger protein n=1 Tax=Hondaea fermentalgiana TaxID=2315210 RepID=A0A2R5GBE5_9STRA|nr:Mitochondrial proton/calcium exchanger protein [Hondaea fermentalgiana]|eukprot:GBG25441.1 Mitochondrial proton/calcium exchanger protein [Hondaea fermentalgiana]